MGNALEDELKRGLTPLGTHLLSGGEVLALLALAHGKDATIHTIEAYRIESDHEIAAVEFSRYGPRDVKSWLAECEQAEMDTLSIVAETSQLPVEVRFQVWLTSQVPNGIHD